MNDNPSVGADKPGLNRPLILLAAVGCLLLADLLWIENGHDNRPLLYAAIGVLLVCGFAVRGVGVEVRLPPALANWFGWTGATTLRGLGLRLGVMTITILLLAVCLLKLTIWLQLPPMLKAQAHLNGDEIVLSAFALATAAVSGAAYLAGKYRAGQGR